MILVYRASSFYIAKRYSKYTRQQQQHLFNGPLSRNAGVSRHWKGKTKIYIYWSKDIGWQWHQLGHTQTLPQTGNHASTPPVSFL